MALELGLGSGLGFELCEVGAPLAETVAVTLIGGAPSGVESAGSTLVRAAVNAVITCDSAILSGPG